MNTKDKESIWQHKHTATGVRSEKQCSYLIDILIKVGKKTGIIFDRRPSYGCRHSQPRRNTSSHISQFLPSTFSKQFLFGASTLYAFSTKASSVCAQTWEFE